VYVRVCMHVYIRMYLCIYVCIYVYMDVYIHVQYQKYIVYFEFLLVCLCHGIILILYTYMYVCACSNIRKYFEYLQYCFSMPV
jgi:hypothetical protein